MTENSRHPEDRRILRRNVIFQYALQGATYLFPLLTLPYLARVLGTDGYAVRAYSVSIMGVLVTFIGYGFNAYGTKQIAKHASEPEHIRRLTTGIFVWRVGFSILCAAILATLMRLVPIMASNQAYMWISFVGACFMGMLPDFIFQGLRDMSILTYRFVASRAISVALIFIFVRGPDDLILVAIFEASANAIAFFWSWTNVVFSRGFHIRLRGLRGTYLRGLLRASTVLFMSSAAATLFSALSTLLIGVYIPAESDIAFWSIAVSIIGAVQALYSPLTNSLYPHVVATGDLSMVKRFLAFGVPSVLVGAVALYVFAGQIASLVGGPDYGPAAVILRLLAPVVVLSFPAVLLGFPVLAAVGWERQLMISSLVSVAFNATALLALALAGAFSIITVAMVRTGTELVLVTLRTYFVWRYWRRQRIATE